MNECSMDWNVRWSWKTEINNRGKNITEWIVNNSKKYYELWKLLLAETFFVLFWQITFLNPTSVCVRVCVWQLHYEPLLLYTKCKKKKLQRHPSKLNFLKVEHWLIKIWQKKSKYKIINSHLHFEKFEKAFLCCCWWQCLQEKCMPLREINCLFGKKNKLLPVT